ncbi:MAG TPA: sn-glycerol-3-phosphate ABC transporter ATP-binding protein UgpC [Candidatus Kapabacteria bacterium]|nr:sn-glycerol-3-phosphate ABC transporter ATP-binding protein UgpC [Candidatus Kapabacteria bacterium]
MASVQLQHISKTYDNKFGAVNDVSFEVKNGEFVVLVGPSGCGKTTTLRMIAGLEDITEGKLLIDEKEMNTVAPKDRDIAMVFQNYALYPHKSVYENLAFSLRLRKFPKPEIDTRVREAAKILSIENILENKPKTLSGGQRQRVAVGRAIVRHPKVFLFDEPLSNLDAQLRVQMRTELLKIHNRLGATMVYVTHDQTEAMTLGDRIVVMKDGVVQQIDAPMDLYAAPNNMFVAEFIGSPPMNFLNGRLERAADGSIVFQEKSDGVKVSLPSSSPEALAKYVDREVIAGVRPENMSVSGGTSAGFSAPVEVVELLGSDMLVYATTPSGVVRIRCDADERRPATGEKVSLQIAPNKVHFFDPATTLRIH